ncbi:MAG: DUF2934 domain-containing protein [Deltaproteobacteria bacterium]
MNKDIGRKPSTTARNEPQELEEEIRCRAFELYEGRGREDGHDFDDWLQAEEEITHKKTRTIAA